MSVLILAFFGGLLTILSPCILPVLPFVFARLGQPFRSSVLPMLVGMAVSFAAVGSLAAISGSWVVQANQTGRLLALVLLAVFGLGLLFPALADRLSQPLVRLGNRLSLRADRARLAGDAVGGSLLLGVAIGLLWAPCAGPILGLILTGAAIGGASGHSALLLLAYGLGAATSLAIALGAGGRMAKGLKRSLGASEKLRRGLGAVVLLAVAAIALGLDRSSVATATRSGASGLEETLVAKLRPTAAAASTAACCAAAAALASSNAAAASAVAWKAALALRAVRSCANRYLRIGWGMASVCMCVCGVCMCVCVFVRVFPTPPQPTRISSSGLRSVR